MIWFDFDSERATHAVLWLLLRHGGRMSRLKLMKLAFLADREHLAKYGRPIVGGQYVAMEHGPVPSTLYDAIKDQSLGDGHAVESRQYDVFAVARPNEDCLSQSDFEVLEDVDRRFGHMDKYALRDMTHKLRAWDKNYKGGKTSYPLPYDDFFLDREPEPGVREIIDEEQEDLELIKSLRA